LGERLHKAVENLRAILLYLFDENC